MCFHSGFNLWDIWVLSFPCLLEGKTLYILYKYNGFEVFMFLLQQSRCIYFWAFIRNLVGVRYDICTTMQIVVGSSPTQFGHRCLKALNMQRARLLKFKIYNIKKPITCQAFHKSLICTPANYIHYVLHVKYLAPSTSIIGQNTFSTNLGIWVFCFKF